VTGLAAPLLAVAVGAALLIAAGVSYQRDKDRAIGELLGMTPGAGATNHEDGLSPVTDRAVELAGHVVERMDRGRSLGNLLERAKIPLRPGEFVIVLGGAALAAAALAMAVSGSILPAAAAGIVVVLLAAQVLRRRVVQRRRAFEAQLPDALSLVASSLAAGHTFLRAVQMMCEESAPPMSEEFSRLVAETRLGDSVVEALERTALRLQIRDLDMVVQAIRIQQSVGGRLADLLHTLADVIRARDEVRREVMVLTAEGRMSAYVLTGLVPLLFLALQFLNPGYIRPLYAGWGLVLLVGCGVSVLAGLFVILRMVKIEV
jgi:tight adherence protein B